MTSDKLPKEKINKTPIPGHPLAKLAGKFKGEFWEKTLENIQEFRKREKQEVNEYFDNQQVVLTAKLNTSKH
ncbi:hypothetical protein NIES267_24000 [Calothrix parasitica NIES-267]|uniref:Uncharacterized protein n=1 Tax=Calothrix parasitica NIES-267 TaxID=1973488 RepID=A0A1Z4LP20_9CYAN|nr:hypothetical protein NIES267_24000 [Calothrix parasitica NIES-267]